MEQQAAMRGLKLLYAAGSYEVTRHLAEAVCHRVGGVNLARYQWDYLWMELKNKSFVKLLDSDQIVVYEPYLEKCVTDYPEPQNDFGPLFEVLKEMQNAAGLFYLGNTQYRAGRQQDAAQSYAASLSINDSLEAHNNYAILLKDMGRREEAEAHYQEALRLRPDDPEAHNNYAILLQDMGRREEAEAHYQEALGLRPDYPEAHNNYANLLQDMGRREEAEAHYQEALRLRPDNPDAHYNYAVLLKDMGRREEAEAHYQEALRLRPDYPEAHNNYAILLLKMGRLAEALHHARQAVRLGPEEAARHDTLGCVLMEMGLSEEAEKEFQ